jgi:hypothetical protein
MAKPATETSGQIIRFIGRRALDAVRQGRFQRSLAAFTALGALVTGAESGSNTTGPASATG